MTILVGILCEDGVVVGSDSAATFSAGSIRTIEEHTSEKIKVISDHVMFATTGSVGHSQRFHEVIKRYYEEKGFSKNPHIESGKKLSASMLKDLSETNALKSPLNFGAIVAFSHDNKPYLLELDADRFQPEFKDNCIWYVTMGSGQIITDPFIGLMRKVFCQDKLPKIALGIFLTMWTLDHVMHVNPGGIHAPKRIGILTPTGGKYKAGLLSSQELEEHENHIRSAEDYMRGYLDILSEDKEVPEIPAVSA